MMLTGIIKFWNVCMCVKLQRKAEILTNLQASDKGVIRHLKAICSTLSIVRCFVQPKSHSIAEIGSISAYRVHLKAETEPISELL